LAVGYSFLLPDSSAKSWLYPLWHETDHFRRVLIVRRSGLGTVTRPDAGPVPRAPVKGLDLVVGRRRVAKPEIEGQAAVGGSQPQTTRFPPSSARATVDTSVQVILALGCCGLVSGRRDGLRELSPDSPLGWG
jgi:hypothetical protein